MSDGGDPVGRVLDRLHAWDVDAYRAIARTSTPILDGSLRRLSDAANYSRLSMAAAGVLAVAGGSRGRRASICGLASVATASATANLGAKLMTRRARPDRENHGVVPERQVPMPESTSFPSGHSAAAFAFAAGVGHAWPVASIPLFVLAGTVAYSRVHTGVHYPGDVIAGSAMGLGAAFVAVRVVDAVHAAAAAS
jgi:membrane-associated phospholipid phosphatase